MKIFNRSPPVRLYFNNFTSIAIVCRCRSRTLVESTVVSGPLAQRASPMRLYWNHLSRGTTVPHCSTETLQDCRTQWALRPGQILATGWGVRDYHCLTCLAVTFFQKGNAEGSQAIPASAIPYTFRLVAAVLSASVDYLKRGTTGKY